MYVSYASVIRVSCNQLQHTATHTATHRICMCHMRLSYLVVCHLSYLCLVVCHEICHMYVLLYVCEMYVRYVICMSCCTTRHDIQQDIDMTYDIQQDMTDAYVTYMSCCMSCHISHTYKNIYVSYASSYTQKYKEMGGLTLSHTHNGWAHTLSHTLSLQPSSTYGVATVSRIAKIIGLFCKRAP